MKYTKKIPGFSIVLAMGLVLFLSLSGLYLMEYMVPFSRNIKGIENASQAYYEAFSGIEEVVLLSYSGSFGEEYSGGDSSDQAYMFSSSASGTLIPLEGKGNSEYDQNWNKLSQNEPISLMVGRDRLDAGGSDRIRISLRVPDVDGSGSPDDLVTSDGVDDIILWQLSSSQSSLTSRSGSLINENDINSNIDEASMWNVTKYSEGEMSDGFPRTFAWFYNNNPAPCDDENNECILKISIIHPLLKSGGDTIPYLEYQVHTDRTIPLSDVYISSKGFSYGFSKNLYLTLPQKSTSSAFDFTVLQ